MKTWTKTKVTDRGTPFPPGPWVDEPDKAHWIDEETDLDCLIHRGPLGALCGYVAVTEGHPAFEKNYNEVDVEVHGGLTYANFCQETDDESYGICHVPLEGRPERVWWLGFDCGHYQDLVPSMLRDDEHMWQSLKATYKDFDYVKAEVESLARQLAAMA